VKVIPIIVESEVGAARILDTNLAPNTPLSLSSSSLPPLKPSPEAGSEVLTT